MKKCNGRNKRKGAALGIILVVLLIMGILVSVLLGLPGGVRRTVPQYERRNQKLYDGASAIMARLEMFPAGYFNREPWSLELPPVVSRNMGPWVRFSADVSPYGNVYAMAGSEYGKISASEVKTILNKLSVDLNRTVMERKQLQQKSGSRRLRGKNSYIDLLLTAGDLTLDLEGNVVSGNFKCDGTVSLKGTTVYDTLRIYASGPVNLSGNVLAKHLEVYSGDHVEISGNFAFSGMIVSKGDVSFGRSSRMDYPAVMISSEGSVLYSSSIRRHDSAGSVFRREVCSDTLGARIPVVSARGEELQDCLLPAVAGGRMVAFLWGME